MRTRFADQPFERFGTDLCRGYRMRFAFQIFTNHRGCYLESGGMYTSLYGAICNTINMQTCIFSALIVVTSVTKTSRDDRGYFLKFSFAEKFYLGTLKDDLQL
jgi:hypothetical protein